MCSSAYEQFAWQAQHMCQVSRFSSKHRPSSTVFGPAYCTAHLASSMYSNCAKTATGCKAACGCAAHHISKICLLRKHSTYAVRSAVSQHRPTSTVLLQHMRQHTWRQPSNVPRLQQDVQCSMQRRLWHCYICEPALVA